ncbi:MAG: hypothetical protein J5871_03275 [Bacteroidales bacterium]|nr:hypothetical protein [Bacteroidales bacterium]
MATCMECGKKLQGRKDKRFCDAHCRNAWHRRVYRESRRIHYRIIRQLEENHSILDNLLKAGITTISRSELELLGFHPGCLTGCSTGAHRHTEHRCFDIRYMITERKIFGISRMLGAE